MMQNKIVRLMIVFLFIASISAIGCSGGGSSSPSNNTNPSPDLTVLPADFDFGVVTDVNSVEPLEVTIQNNGTADLSVSGISISDRTNFNLDLNGGATPCASAAPTIDPGQNCTVSVDFVPQATVVPASGIDYSAVLTITSNDPDSSTYEVGLTGKRQNITAISVKINQIDACPRAAGEQVKAYVSVTDQGGFPVTTLEADDFTLREAGADQSVATDFVDNKATLSIALLMDYSYSITQEPDNVADMEKAAINFVGQLGDDDEAEIIKYATTIDTAQSFTSDRTALVDAIQATTSLGGQTALYDAIALAVTDISSRSKDRSAIIIITDGEDNDGTGSPLSESTLSEVIAQANAAGIPVFTVGLGDRVEPAILLQLADETGGTYYPSTTSDNLVTIYQQLASLLFIDQYILTYTTQLESTDSGTLEITATYTPGISDSDTVTIPACP